MHQYIQLFSQYFSHAMSNSWIKNFIILLTSGIHSKQLTLSAIARETCQNGKYPFTTELTRASRFCKMPSEVLMKLNKILFSIITYTHSEIILILDWTQIGKNWVLVASLPLLGRAIPIWLVSIPVGLKRDRETLMEWGMLVHLSKILKNDQMLYLVADRGFAKLEFLQCRPWDNIELIIRLKSSFIIEWDGLSCKIKNFMVIKGDNYTLEEAYIGKDRIKTSVEISWNPNCEKPLFVAGPLSAINYLINIYGKRFWVENSFRDLKFRFHCHWSFNHFGYRLPDNTNQQSIDNSLIHWNNYCEQQKEKLSRIRVWMFLISVIMILRYLIVKDNPQLVTYFSRKYKDGRSDLSFIELGRLIAVKPNFILNSTPNELLIELNYHYERSLT